MTSLKEWLAGMTYRFQALWNVLLGRPTIYGVRFVGEIHLHRDNPGALISTCQFEPDKAQEKRFGLGQVWQ